MKVSAATGEDTGDFEERRLHPFLFLFKCVIIHFIFPSPWIPPSPLPPPPPPRSPHRCPCPALSPFFFFLLNTILPPTPASSFGLFIKFTQFLETKGNLSLGARRKGDFKEASEGGYWETWHLRRRGWGPHKPLHTVGGGRS